MSEIRLKSSGTNRYDAIMQGLCADLTAIDDQSDEFKQISQWAKVSDSSIKLKNIFTVKRAEEATR